MIKKSLALCVLATAVLGFSALAAMAQAPEAAAAVHHHNITAGPDLNHAFAVCHDKTSADSKDCALAAKGLLKEEVKASTVESLRNAPDKAAFLVVLNKA